MADARRRRATELPTLAPEHQVSPSAKSSAVPCGECERLSNQFLIARTIIEEAVLVPSDVDQRQNEQLLGFIGDLRDRLASAFNEHRHAAHPRF